MQDRLGKRVVPQKLASIVWIALLVGIWTAIISGSIPLPFRASATGKSKSKLFFAEDPLPNTLASRFNGARALDLARSLVNLGSRRPESYAHARAVALLQKTLEQAGWTVEIETFSDPTASDVTFVNLRAYHKDRGDFSAHSRSKGEIFLVARYDSASNPLVELPAALDSAAGPAFVCEIARVLGEAPKLSCRVVIYLVDGSSPLRQFSPEDGLRGSRMVAALLEQGRANKILAVLVVRGVGGEPARLTIPTRSNPILSYNLETIVRELGLVLELERLERPMWDDDLPFLAPGRKVLLLHDGKAEQIGTADDTPEKLSAKSFEVTGRAIIHLISRL